MTWLIVGIVLGAAAVAGVVFYFIVRAVGAITDDIDEPGDNTR